MSTYQVCALFVAFLCIRHYFRNAPTPVAPLSVVTTYWVWLEHVDEYVMDLAHSCNCCSKGHRVESASLYDIELFMRLLYAEEDMKTQDDLIEQCVCTMDTKVWR